jgi:hypothetical protein
VLTNHPLEKATVSRIYMHSNCPSYTGVSGGIVNILGGGSMDYSK